MAGTARSCTACRQAKVGCDARRKPINTPCTRCDKNQIECRFDKNFKRILTRKLTANLTNELHQLRVSQAQAALDEANPSQSPLLSTIATDTQSRDPESSSSPPSPAHVPFFFANVAEPLSDFAIGNVTVPPKTVIELIQHFGDQYYPYAYFVKPVESLALSHASCPLLFWTIVLVASQHHPTHSGLYEPLLSPYEDFLKPFSNTAIQSIHEIHALLLLCLWPVPNRTEAISPTWNYISLAVGACIRLNLDKAGPLNSVEPLRSTAPRHQRRPEEVGIQTRRLTWLACLAITTQEATFLGLLPPFSSRFYSKRSRRAVDELKDYLLPGVTPKFAICEIICNYNLVLEEVDSPSAQLSLVETFNSSLDRIWHTYSAEWNTDVDVLLQYAKLNLDATALMQILMQNEATCSQHHTDIQILIIQGTEAASRLISNMKTMISEALASEGRPAHMIMPLYYPRFYFGILFFAAVFIFRASYMKPSVNHDVAVEGLIEVANIYRLYPRHPDLKTGVDLIQHILRYARSEEFLSSPTGSLITTNRLGASFVWDTMMRTAQFSGEERLTGADNEHQALRATHNTVAGSSAMAHDSIIHDTSEAAGTLPLPINLDWGDIDLAFPTFDIFGLEAGEHIIW
ncbi:hypothetical protein F4801DRAFT_97062 [Xylaria longipes]|nr:hypothetical protein F4801DRAFT_97062 [Xylaria longipes]